MRKPARVAVLLVLLSGFVLSIQGQTTIPAGTNIVISLDQTVSSKDAKVGQEVAASVARDVIIDGKKVIPKGSPAVVHVVSVQASGRLSTPAKLYLRLDSVNVNGKAHAVSAHLVGSIGKSHGKRNAEAIGGGAAAGAVIGALAGGGKGAAIGAGVGAGAGTAGAAATGKKDITYGAETRLSFSLRVPVNIK